MYILKNIVEHMILFWIHLWLCVGFQIFQNDILIGKVEIFKAGKNWEKNKLGKDTEMIFVLFFAGCKTNLEKLKWLQQRLAT